ncbi:hypothetical protein [Flavobacterium sp. LB2P53]|uniref:hypothetical protein n=1 Tax=Flavobacterium sp. LB2P53 TaxID=2497481 RepID=UPI000F82D298|nr:hypothetical protein [Flavobacterium sp. LB2P53]RTY65539.1 hypothetical protein EKL95_12720 [Flavobacterium sp. LB2P53]
MKKEIFKKVEDSIENLKKLENRTEFNIWYFNNFGLNIKNMDNYHEALKSVGIDINDFPIVMSFTLKGFNNTLKKLKDESII